MKFSLLSSCLTLTLFSLTAASPLEIRDVASCETATTAQQVACTEGCNGNTACITACAATAAQSYTSCAGVKRDTTSCEDEVANTEEACIDACPVGSRNTGCVSRCSAAASKGYLACE